MGLTPDCLVPSPHIGQLTTARASSTYPHSGKPIQIMFKNKKKFILSCEFASPVDCMACLEIQVQEKKAVTLAPIDMTC